MYTYLFVLLTAYMPVAFIIVLLCIVYELTALCWFLQCYAVPNKGLIMKKLIADSTLTVELPESRMTVKEEVNSDTDSEDDTQCRLIAKGRKALHTVWNYTNSLLHIILYII